eukprot:1140354-Pelagomonas_calceolata.AAC.1
MNIDYFKSIPLSQCADIQKNPIERCTSSPELVKTSVRNNISAQLACHPAPPGGHSILDVEVSLDVKVGPQTVCSCCNTPFTPEAKFKYRFTRARPSVKKCNC